MSRDARVLGRGALLAALAPRRRAGESVALANGLFDLLHVGHLRYLQGAAAEADLLVVAINSDRSARELKGPSRPLVPEDERAELVAGFGCVDYVTVFDELDAREVLRAVRPDVHCKGSDYTPDTVPEADLAAEMGWRITIVGDAKGHATSSLIERIKKPRT